MGDLSNIDANREAFKEKYKQVYPEVKKGNIATGAGMLYRFVMKYRLGISLYSHRRATVK